MVDGKSYNLNNKEERDEYFRRVRAKQGFEDDVGIMMTKWWWRGQRTRDWYK